MKLESWNSQYRKLNIEQSDARKLARSGANSERSEIHGRNCVSRLSFWEVCVNWTQGCLVFRINTRLGTGTSRPDYSRRVCLIMVLLKYTAILLYATLNVHNIMYVHLFILVSLGLYGFNGLDVRLYIQISILFWSIRHHTRDRFSFNMWAGLPS